MSGDTERRLGQQVGDVGKPRAGNVEAPATRLAVQAGRGVGHGVKLLCAEEGRSRECTAPSLSQQVRPVF